MDLLFANFAEKAVGITVGCSAERSTRGSSEVVKAASLSFLGRRIKRIRSFVSLCNKFWSRWQRKVPSSLIPLIGTLQSLQGKRLMEVVCHYSFHDLRSGKSGQPKSGSGIYPGLPVSRWVNKHTGPW